MHGSWLIMQKQETRSVSANENIKSFQMEGGLNGLRPRQSQSQSQTLTTSSLVPAPKKLRLLLLLLHWGFLLLFSLDTNNITTGSLKAVNNIHNPSLSVFLSHNYFRKSSRVILTTTPVLLSYKIWHLLMMLHFIVKISLRLKLAINVYSKRMWNL